MRSRYKMLSSICDNLFVIFITKTDEKCPIGNSATLRVDDRITPQNIANLVSFIKQKSVSVAYFSYSLFGHMPSQLPCKTIVEIHDVLHLRQEQFQKYGYDAPIKVDKNAEIESLKQYDWVISINLDEVEYLKKNGLSKCVYVPPTMEYQPIPNLQDGEISAGFIGSSAKPNIDGLISSIGSIRDFPRLVFAGSISQQPVLDQVPPRKIKRMGIIPNVATFYSKIDVALSPIRFGAGLKIKVFEALAFGKRLMATSHSISGFPLGIDEIVTLEDDFSQWNTDLLQQTMKLEEANIEEYFQANFSLSSTEKILRTVSATPTPF